MRSNDLDAIIPNKLYLGNLRAARSTRSLAEHRITHILSVCPDAIPAELPQSGFHHMRISVEDVDFADLLIHLPSACRFIHQAVQSRGAILVHDVEGLSRSAAVVAAYLMWSQQISATRALDIIRESREHIWPNAGFQEQLVLFELCQYAPSPSNGIYRSWRYKIDRHLAGRR
ncbi:phosphatases II [Mycena metata]|uniref:protein-tyrosine-phosphatase n=1 Tax=Mycena metata TaxID=1033252 RepID=A0AAD7HKM7_9AGAR|nr:phosphatases II [Mycena metata]